MAGYSVVIRAISNTLTFPPGNVILTLDDIHNLAWTEYLNDVGEAFFTVRQDDEKIQAIRSAVNAGAHMAIYRDGTQVWGGYLGEADETYEDAIVYGYSYISPFYMLLSDWGQTWTGANVNTIIENLFDRGKSTLSNSRVGWLTKGTIQTLWTTTGGPTTLTLPIYKIYYKRILDAFKELVAYAISDTTNRVVFEVTPTGTFNLWRDRGTTISNIQWRVGDGGKIRDYRRIRMPVDKRTDLKGVGSSPTVLDLKYEAANTVLRANFGRAEEPVFMQFVRDQAELERVMKLRLARAGRTDTDLLLSFHGNSLIPYRAPSADYSLSDIVNVYLNRGLSANESESKIIVGQQVLYHRQVEHVRLLLADRL